MTTKYFFIAVLFVFLVGGSGLTHVYFLNDYYLQPGQEMFGLVGIWNNEDRELHDVFVNIDILGTSVRYQSMSFDVQARENYGKYFFIDILRNMQPGGYIVKISANTETDRLEGDTMYRYIQII